MGENYITCQGEKGSINISEEVINGMVRTAIAEVEGVAGLSNTAGAELAELIGLKTVTRGVKIQSEDNVVTVDVIITVVYGANIVKVSAAVQDRVIDAVRTATGMDQVKVNVHVAGIAFDK